MTTAVCYHSGMAKKEGIIYVSIRVPTDLWQKLRALADSHHHSMNAEILNLIEQAVADRA